MSALNFPDAPSPGQLFSPPPPAAGIWLWDGSKWVNGGGPNNYLLLNGGHLSNPGNLIVDGTLQVAGATTLAAATTVTINVSGATTLGSTLAVTGAATLSSTLAVTGATTLGGTLGVTGATTLGSATGVTLPTADNSVGLATTAFVKNQAYAPAAGGNYLSLSGGTVNGAVNINGQLGPRTINFGVYAASISPIAMNSYNWGWGWDGTVHWYVNGGDQGQTWMMTNQSGWAYLGTSFRAYDIQSNNNVNAAGSLFYGGCQLYNASGWGCSPQSFRSSGNLSADGGVVYLNGMYWQNNGGWMYCPWQTRTDGTLQAGGNVVAGGGSGQLGGWGVYTSFMNGNWHTCGAADAFYSYTNAGISGWCYWDGSDVRMKSNFGAIERDCLAAINAIELQSYDFVEGEPKQRRTNPNEMRPEFFQWETLPRKNRHFQSGFVAQQVREIIPEAVPDMQEADYLGVDMRPLVATLIGAVQQLTKRLAAVEDK